MSDLGRAQQQPEQNHGAVSRVLWLILFLNLLVAGAKMVFGYLIGSLSMVADGFHSVSDGASNVIGLLGVRIASQPPDPEHPYGHRKFETFATLPIAGLLLLAAWRVGSGVVERLQAPDTVPNVTHTSIGVMIGTLCINVGVAYYERRRASELNSDFLEADAAHTLSDVWVSSSVIVSLLATRLGYPIMDVIVGGIIAVVIAWTAIGIARRGAGILADSAAVDPGEIREMVEQLPDVHGAHSIRTRGRSDNIHVDLHVLVDREMTIHEGHMLSHRIEDVLKENFGEETDVIVHLEPDEDQVGEIPHE